MKILHLSDTTLSGAPIRVTNLFNKYTQHDVRHMVWEPVVRNRVFETDLVSSMMNREEVVAWLNWADIIHYHNRWARQRVFEHLGLRPPSKPSVIQIHSPRQSEDFSEELECGLPLAVVAQYHPREWPELKFIVPNVVDIYDADFLPSMMGMPPVPAVSYAPSNCICKGWDDKGYGVVAPILKRMRLKREIDYQLIVNQPYKTMIQMKRQADIGIDEIVTGSYHLSSLEYLAMGVACFANLDEKTEKVVRDLTGCEPSCDLPWIKASPDTFEKKLRFIAHDRLWGLYGQLARVWMEKYWNPLALVGHYERMYTSL